MSTMWRSNMLPAIVTLLVLFGCEQNLQPPEGKEMTSFEAGQVWTYRTRPGEESSRVIVCLVESHPEIGEVVHVSVTRVNLKNPQAPGGSSDRIAHMPFEQNALRHSVLAIESSGSALPPFEDGYEEWREAKGGAWTMPLSEAISAMEGILND